MKLSLLSESDLDIIRILFSFDLGSQLRNKPSGFHDEDRFDDDYENATARTVHFTDGVHFYIISGKNTLCAVKAGSDIKWLDLLQLEQQFPQHWKLYLKYAKIRPSEAKGFIYRSYNERERKEWLDIMAQRP